MAAGVRGEGGGPGMQELKLSELIGALSHALDMTEGQPRGHCVRCAWIGMALGERLGPPIGWPAAIYAIASG